jgi:ADP-ribosylglycohydrolase
MMKEKGEYKPAVLELSTIQSRSIAAIMGMAVADALGASTEFEHFNKKGLGAIKKGFRDIKKGRHGKIGIWTDDAAMGLCIADSVLLNDYVFNPTHIRYLFTLWLRHGLNNGGRPHSIGLGGNISISM